MNYQNEDELLKLIIKMKIKCMKYDYQSIAKIIFEKMIQIELNCLCTMHTYILFN